MTYLKKWPPFWREDEQGKKIQSWRYLPEKVAEAQVRIDGSDVLLRELADTVLELKANTDQLEEILTRMKDEDD